MSLTGLRNRTRLCVLLLRGGTTFKPTCITYHNKLVAPVTAVTSYRASFLPQYKGTTYITVLVDEGDSIGVGMFSNIEFPIGRIPPAVRKMIAELPIPGNGFRLITSNGPEAAHVIAHGYGSPGALTPHVFVESIDEMMAVIGYVDAWIMHYGYAR